MTELNEPNPVRCKRCITIRAIKMSEQPPSSSVLAVTSCDCHYSSTSNLERHFLLHNRKSISGTTNVLSPENQSELPNTKKPYLVALTVESVVYAVYLGLCCLCVYLLRTRRTSISYIFLSSAFALFCIATGDLVSSYYLLFGGLLKGSLTPIQLFPKSMVYVACNTISDSILLFRCYIICQWGRNRHLLFGLGVIS
ncbi:hypothetical protein BDN72DRAFT_653152 [Pluteus cervinus]|uniref:Uncharacterized protein n=1 Tax=Pluteus cervinus TaxID=181527 RepID=A0ACD3AU08_9AGAR|nr:hypothetical protein BDN72DRAFT_653152 [Pluteus cervinus]